MDALRKMKEGIEAKKEEALMKVEEKKEALIKVKENMEAKKEEALNKVNEKKEALMKVKEDVEEKKMEAVRKVKEEVEEKKEALMNLKEDVEEKIEPVKMFFRGRMVGPISGINTTNIVSTLSTINTAVPPASAIEYDSDSSDSSKGSAESLNDEKVNGKSRKRHSHRNGDTASLITSYPAVNSPPLNVVVHQSHGEQIFYPGVKYSGVQESALNNHQGKDNVAKKGLNGFSPSAHKILDQNGTYTSFEEGSTSENRIVNLGNKISEEVTEIYLEKLYQKPESHEFYCPNCKTCITKVLIIRERYLEAAPNVAHPNKEDLRCSNCFAFLIPVGNWIRNIFASKNPAGQGNAATLTPTPKPLPSNSGNNAGLEEPLLPYYSDKGLGDQISREPQTVGNNAPVATEPSKHIIHHSGGNPPHGAVENSGVGSTVTEPGDGISILMPPPNEQLLGTEPRSTKSWEILKSIVYGGLTESITSLGIVTSAASADAATLNVIALALANLIGGLFVICHNLWEFKNDESTVTSKETGQQVDRYEEVLGQKTNFIFHVPAAILAFLIFGLVPPVVYGFSFHESDDKDLKLAAVAGASLLCITLLALAKARTQRNPKYMKTVLQYVAVGFGVSGASYVAGNLLDRLMEKLGWFQQTHVDKTFPLPQFM
ncbi:membrane protein of ER body-like protein isoform X2 [Ziziphus jujuba]|uniref:Membrane protein of ER body-like protein isoform X2 n=1 Tax=Ziziphus jujuba TaxID=326968 RepID=A0ABM3IVW1_ZIZJJ|nr:membrane protein of ER body-like protein isoform X2 [Ziziphus jujuba]